eukprot:CAMPEP_0196761828 /NCGR_PEP_ID=MMETSP1095-20130614/1123_1 /TAXON_ID=96789 ORGANISM="Chromulina nebulosa, Strain UTEXLB2642" /NCGR_SAMPLE_ID=MMETSP1095 /ASSEMBLY_ACC=CAM_ASM_000446 /LENGTH=157 /DNA_ID=CAMNT_0042111823 /DNA_START=105 /DNA_END=578 /DNA_ORIENTATION=+
MIGDIKFGVLKGTDRFGNKYYEDLSAPFNQHRWIEYADIHDFDASMIQPEWHGWMHHMYDEVPGEGTIKTGIPLTPVSHAVYKNHVGYSNVEPLEQVNLTTYRSRGYKVGSLKTGPDEPDRYYKQPGHPLHPLVEKGGRYKHIKSINGFFGNKAFGK